MSRRARALTPAVALLLAPAACGSCAIPDFTGGFAFLLVCTEDASPPAHALIDATSGLGLTPAEDFDEGCFGCRATGETCALSINCPVGDICNDPADELFDAARPERACIRVTCSNDSDCVAPKVCTLERVCELPVCLTDSACPADLVCVGGSCLARPAPARVARCEILTESQVIRTGTALRLRALAFDAANQALPGVELEWTSGSTAAAIRGELAVSSTVAGTAMMEARAKNGVRCAGGFELISLPPADRERVRVLVVESSDGAPISGARVEIRFSSTSTPAIGTTDARGLFDVPAAGELGSVAASATDHQGVLVFTPAGADLLLSLPRRPRRGVSRGFHGAIDLSAVRKGDLPAGRAGAALRSEELGFGIDRAFCRTVPTHVQAPDLGVDVTVDFPRGAVSALGSKRFTEAPSRCLGFQPRPGAVGCFTADAPPAGPDALWTIASQFELSQVSRLGSRLCGPTLCGAGHGLLDPSLMVRASHGLELGLTAGEPFSEVTIAADSRARQLSRVRMPLQPITYVGDGIQCPPNAALISGVLLPRRGFVPFGHTSARDTRGDDCLVDWVAPAPDPAFDPSELEPGVVPVYLAPPHGGAEGNPFVLMALAHDGGAFAPGAPLRLRGMLRVSDDLKEHESFDSERYLLPPRVRLMVDDRRLSLETDEPELADKVLRVHLGPPDERWVIYAPASMASAEIPAVAGMPDLASGLYAAAELIEVDETYSGLWAFGSGRNLEPMFLRMTRFTIEGCSSDPDAACRIE